MAKELKWKVRFTEEKSGVDISENWISVPNGKYCMRRDMTKKQFIESIRKVIKEEKYLIKLYKLAIDKYQKEFLN